MLKELKHMSIENKNVVYVLLWNFGRDRAYLCNGKTYFYEFCGNLNYVIREGRRIVVRERKDVADYCIKEVGTI